MGRKKTKDKYGQKQKRKQGRPGWRRKDLPVLWDFLKLVNSRWHWAEQVKMKIMIYIRIITIKINIIMINIMIIIVMVIIRFRAE